MRILLVSYFYPPSVGGVERQSHLLARALVSRGHSVQVITALSEGVRQREILDGVAVERVPAGRGSRWQKMATFLVGMLLASARSLPHVDLVQVQQLLYPAAGMALAQPIFRLPLVVRNSGSGQFGGVRLMQSLPLGQFGLRVTARRATGVSLNAEMTREMRDVGFQRVVEIPNGVIVPANIAPVIPLAARQELGLNSRVVLYVGRLEDEKGVDLLIKGWQLAGISDATLLIVGDGSRRTELELLAAQPAQNAGRVSFRGFQDLSRYYAAADLFVLPSRSEGLSNALLEAMAHGLPVIATNVGGNREILSNDATGCLVPAEQPDAIATAMQRLLSDDERRVRLARNARAYVKRRYSMAAMVDAYERLYEELIVA